MTAQEYRAAIFEKLPPGSVVPDHTETQHFYKVPSIGKRFGSVTGKLQILKDEGLMNYKMNRALDHVYQNWDKIKDMPSAMEVIGHAKLAPAGILEDAGDIGTQIHDARERYFDWWIQKGAPSNLPLTEFIDPRYRTDRRAISGMRAIERFCRENEYQPVVSELYVYSEEWEIGGALDDIGIVKWEGRWRLCLMDLKTSNRFKDTYFFQVAMYWEMFRKLTGIEPDLVLILKASKEDGTYKVEEITELPRLVEYAGHMLKVNEAVSFIKALRKDNQKEVVKL